MIPIDQTFAAQVIQPRRVLSHKGTFGRVLIIAGNANYGGAGIMSAQGAVYAGSGLTTIATNQQNWTALHARLPEAMVTDWTPATLIPLIKGADVIVIGPGLGTDTAAQAVLNLTFSNVTSNQTLIIDGSAITLVAQEQPTLPSGPHIIWTPHAEEWARLSGIPRAEQTNLAANAAARAKISGTLILKGAPTRIYTDNACFENTAGGPAMATGGSGDTLTGILAACCAQFGSSAETIATAVWLHSAAADRVAQTDYVALPDRVVQVIPALMHDLAYLN